jgi:hypothetical protein
MENIIQEQKFDTVWWDSFLEKTNDMSKTQVIENCISKVETEIMQSYILNILSDLAALRTNKHGYRVYIDSTLLNNNEMLQIYDSPPLQNENLKEWANRTFGDKKFGMIINEGERFNLELSKSIALKLSPLLEKIGMPTEGIIFTLFIGNYDKTPLGIHKDLPGKSVIHFHLGPSPKTMYTWDTEEYLSLVGEKKHNNQDVKKYIPFAQKFVINEGDLYFMPEDLYHVGTQDDLSIAIACWCYNRSNYDFALRLQTLFQEQTLQKSILNLKADKNEIYNTDAVEKTLDLFEIPKELENLSFKDLMRETYKDLRFSLFSNAGYRTSPFAKKLGVELSIDDIIEVEKPFKILYKNSLDSQKMHLYVRGVKIELNNFDCIKKFIDEINKEEKIKISKLLKFLNSDWDSKIGLYILELIYKHHGIKIVK